MPYHDNAPSSRDEGHELLSSLTELSFDPAFQEFVYEDVADLRLALSRKASTSEEAVDEAFEAINKVWGSAGWLGESAMISGKLRFRYTDDECMEDVEDFLPRELWRYDERGEYIEVAAHDIVCSCITMRQDEADAYVDMQAIKNGEVPPIGLAVFLDEMYDETSDYVDEGQLIMYLDEISQLEFYRPSHEALRRRLAYYAPRTYEQANRQLKWVDTSSMTKVRQFLRSFYAPNEKIEDYPLESDLGMYLFGEIGFTDNIHKVVVSDVIYGVSIDEEIIPSEIISKPKTLYGVITGITMMPDEEDEALLRPCVILSTLSDNLWTAYIIPPNAIEHIKTPKSSPIEFGKRAGLLMTYDYPGQATNHLMELTAVEYEPDTADQSTPKTPNDDKAGTSFDDEMGAFSAEINDRPVTLQYDEKHHEWRTPLQTDLKKLVKAFGQYAEKLGVADATCGVDPAAYATIEHRLMQLDVNLLDELQVGCTVRADKGLLLLPNDDNSYDIIMLEPSVEATGKFASIGVNDIPEPDLYDARTDEVMAVSSGVVLVLDQCRIDGHNEEAIDGALLYLSPTLPRAYRTELMPDDA